eukprot:6248769-Amphidinium_carterae.1
MLNHYAATTASEPSSERLGPLLKYFALGASAEDDITSEVTCAVAVSATSIVLGTVNGVVILLCHDGPFARCIREADSTAIIAIDVDPTGQVAAFATSAHYICVLSLVKESEGKLRSWTYSCAQSQLSVAIAPSYASGATDCRMVCFAGEDGKLVLARRNTFNTKTMVVHSGEGSIPVIRWRGSLIAWANGRGVKVLDVQTYQK